MSTPEERFHWVVAAILTKGDKVLMVHRSPDREWAPDTWDVPGGHIEGGERTAEAVQRELREELDIEVAPDALTEFARLRGPTWHVTYFKIESWSGEISNAAPHEHTSLQWMTVDELSSLQLADPDLLQVLKTALR